MIPKVIHYCWFGRGEKPRLIRQCIRSWKKYCPDYQIIEWNEDNYDLASSPLFVRQAVNMRKWAFATDYARLKIIYEHGGIYLDTDVELIKPLDGLLNNKAYFGFQKKNGMMRIATGLGFGAEAGMPILLEIMKVYETNSFLNASGEADWTANTIKETEVLKKHGLIEDGTEQILDGMIHIYPPDYFNPKVITKGFPVDTTANTVSIHWYTSSWNSEEQLRAKKKWRRKRLFTYYFSYLPRRFFIDRCVALLGEERYKKLKNRMQFHAAQKQRKAEEDHYGKRNHQN